MAKDGIDVDAYTRPYMLTAKIRRDVYPAIDPTNPELSAAGKVIVVIGATGGIGFATAREWNRAGARGIVLVGRRQEALDSTVAALMGPAKIITVSANIIDAAACAAVMERALTEFGSVDVLVNSAGGAIQGMIREIEPAKWWQNLELNLRGAFNINQAFIKATDGKGTIVNIGSMGAGLTLPAMSGSSVAQLGLIKLCENMDFELPGIRVFVVHPGIVALEDGRGAVLRNMLDVAKDTPALTAGLTLYLATPRADFLKGGYLHANWDVEEMELHKREIVEKRLHKLAFLNAKLQEGGYSWSDAPAES